MLLADIAAARGSPVPVIPSSALSSTPDSEATATSIQSISYPFNFLLTSATIPTSLATYLSNYQPSLICLASPRLQSDMHEGIKGEVGGNKERLG
jgi:ATP-dependent RNA helicase MRH4